MRVEQISILLRNEPGVLSRILENLSRASVNILGLTINETANFGELRIVTDKCAMAKEILKEMAVSYNVVKIIVIKLDNKPGELLKIAHLMSKNDINIDYIYTLASVDKGALIAVKTWNMAETEKILGENHFEMVDLDKFGL
ncbi:MAG TPA: hypothetical protein PLV42_11710 [bacterium]|nr:hypothetical protein [bacterium]